MPHMYDIDHILTQSYIPKISSEFDTPPEFIPCIKPFELGHVHEGRMVDPLYPNKERIERGFHFIGFDCLLNINEPICPRFILEFYSSVNIKRDQNYIIHLKCKIGHYNVHVSLKQFAQILELPSNGQCAYSEKFDLNSLLENREDEGPYRTYVPSSAKIIESICQTSNTLHPNKIHISELCPGLQAMAVFFFVKTFSVLSRIVSMYQHVVLTCCIA